MNTQLVRLAIALAVGLIPNMAWAQHEGHQMTGTQPPSVELTQCLRAQPAVENIITAAMQRAEAARLSNSPSALRAALDHLEAALRDIRTQSAPCATAAMSADPHEGHTMPGTQTPSTPSTAEPPAGAEDPHAGHTMPSAPSART